jgi:putative transposase
MARPLRIEFPGAFYHVTSRGNERKAVFKSTRDREKFLAYLESATERYGAAIHVYCLMDNHYHLLIETPLGNLSKIMQHINGAYTMYFNTKRKRSGHLLQGRYKAILVDADEYSKELSRYIHLNPVRAGMESNSEAYRWSSCRYYTHKRKAPGWLQRDFILGYFGKRRAPAMKMYREFVRSAMKREYPSPLSKRLHAVILGSQDFVEDIKAAFLHDRKPDRDLPDLKEAPAKREIEDIDKAVDRLLKSDPKFARQVKLYFCHRYTGLKLKEIGRWYGLSESGVTQASRRVALKAETDWNVVKMLDKIAAFVKV